jgi:hypothetical protein
MRGRGLLAIVGKEVYWAGGKMSTKKKRTWRWVTRDGQDDLFNTFMDIHSHHVKPKWDGRNFHSEEGAAWVCYKEFKKLTGIDIQPGECVKVEFSAKVVK